MSLVFTHWIEGLHGATLQLLPLDHTRGPKSGSQAASIYLKGAKLSDLEC